MGTAHSKIGASSMYRWSACPGSVKLSEGIESKSSSYAEEGTRAHDVAAKVLENGKWPGGVDDEMRTAVAVYVDAVTKDEKIVPSQLLVEHRFDLSQVHPGLFGTADAVLYHAKEKLLRVFDYKHGAGIAVEVANNPQLLYYGLGALLTSGFKAATVELVIVQPRCPHPDGAVRRWRLDAVDLMDFAADLVQYAKATEVPNAPLVPGDHCRFCPASGICPKLKEKALALAQEEFSAVVSYDKEKLARALEWLPTLEAWIKSVREFAYAEAEHGRPVPGYKLVNKRATRKWANPDEASRFINQRFMSNVATQCFSDPELKSPPQIEKLLSKADMALLDPYIEAKSSGTTLVPVSDPRPEVNRSLGSEFEKVPVLDLLD